MLYFKNKMKRLKSGIQIINNSSLKKQKLDTNIWVSATDIFNYMKKDPLVDWLKITRSNFKTEKNGFLEFIMKKGLEFEQAIIDFISNKIPIVTVSDKITEFTCNTTIDLMKKGFPIIHSAPFINNKNNTKGVIDLLIRSDKIGELVNENPLPEQSRFIKAPNLNGNYHYLVIDIKFSTLPLRANGIHLLNSDNYPAYKAQTWIYTQAIGEIQGYTSNFAFILGRRWTYFSKGEKYYGNCLDRLGVIDYNSVDSEYPGKTKDAINWVVDVRTNSEEWIVDTNNVSRKELYPNMCVDSGEWNKEKQRIAEEIGEITNIWYCGVQQRENCLKLGITSWKDPRCTSFTMGITGIRGTIIDEILNINRQEIDKIRPKKIVSTELKNSKNEIFVDFETFVDIFSDMGNVVNQNKTAGIFLIGVYYMENGIWIYKSFLVNSTSKEEEYRIMDEFITFIKNLNYPKMWYWHAEKNIWKEAENSQMDRLCKIGDPIRADHIVDNWKIFNWFDMCELFKTEKIVIKDCFTFGLKDVAKALYKHGFIQTRMESNCDNGLVASVNAWNLYNNHDNLNPIYDPIMLDILKYNRFDVQVLYEIISFLRRIYD